MTAPSSIGAATSDSLFLEPTCDTGQHTCVIDGHFRRETAYLSDEQCSLKNSVSGQDGSIPETGMSVGNTQM